MREIVIEVPDNFGKTLEPLKVNVDIKGELVRCKDCKYWSRQVCNVRCIPLPQEDDYGFCDRAERR